MRLNESDWHWIGGIAGLTERKCRIMALRYVEQLSSAAIAQLENISPRTVDVHVHQSWVRLQLHQWDEDLLPFARTLMEINERDHRGEPVPESDWEWVAKLLWCYRNRMPGKGGPPAAVDARGRKIMGMPVVGIEDFLPKKQRTA